MVDPNRTTVDWQLHPSHVCVWGIGSMEQHGSHMPLATDTIFADSVARFAAEDLGAALLPTLPFGTCLEHTGFRGSFSLRPETLMQIVRDMAGEAGRQGFRVLVIVNGHGGNHALTPVVRDINRADGPLKVLLLNLWEHADPGLDKVAGERQPAFHADAWETSLLLALRPDLVTAARPDAPERAAEPHPLGQRDLSTFGVGQVVPDGVAGSPSLASAELGRAVLESVRRNLAALLRDRIARLGREPHYAGSGGIALRALVEEDLPDCMRLKGAAGWNQTESDWRFFLRTAPAGCHGAFQDGRLLGTAAGVAYGAACAWVSMVLVDPAFRRHGLGRRLMDRTLSGLAGVPAIGLDATSAGQPLYRKLGFQDDRVMLRTICPSLPAGHAPADGLAPATPDQLAGLVAADAAAFGSPREAVIRYLLDAAPERAWMRLRNGRVSGFCLGRPGSGLNQVGPVVADSLEDAQALILAAVRSLRGRPAVLDVPEAQAGLLEWLAGRGFRVERELYRMWRGAAPAGDRARQFVTAGPDLG